MPSVFSRVLAAHVVASAAMLASPSAYAQAPADASKQIQAPNDERFVRTLEDEAAGKITLQMAVRRFERVGQPGPTVTMHSAIHIADRPFYEKLQAMLDAKDVVLFESVKPPGMGRPEHALKGADSDEFKISTTKMRLRLLGIAAKLHERRTGMLPADMNELLGSIKGKMEAYAAVLEKDGWDRPFAYTLIQPEPAEASDPADARASAAAKKLKPTFDIVSLGSDNAEGGEGAAADIKLSKQKPIRPRDLPKDDDKGLQADMAKALGLVFQLDAMSHEKPNWRNSDLSIDQVQERLAAGGADPEELFKMLDGSSLQAGALRIVLGLIKLMPSVQVMGKVVMMEALGKADQLMESVPGMDKTMDVIVKDRNQVVIDDLSAIIEKEPNVKTVGIIYGGAHMPDLESSLAKMGYHEAGVEWIDAITVDLPKSAAERKQLESMRQTIRSSLEQQIKQAKKAAEKKKAEE